MGLDGKWWKGWDGIRRGTFGMYCRRIECVDIIYE